MRRHDRDESACADLHLHSTHSDGLLSPTAIVDLAADFGMQVIALTDHDTFDGLAEARRQASARGIEIIPGVEVSTQHPRAGERHVLALGVDENDAPLRKGLQENQSSRDGRVEAMVEALAGQGVALTAEDVRSGVKGSVGRPHVADALVRAGHVRSRQEAFDRWLADGKVAHVPKVNLDVRRAIDLIHGAGGVAILAHPGRRWDPALIEDLVRSGLDGLEVIHPSNSAKEQQELSAMASRFGLLITGGSDNHGDREGREAMRTQRVPRAWADAVIERSAVHRGSRA